jgi:hypothetical protein
LIPSAFKLCVGSTEFKLLYAVLNSFTLY